MMVVINAERSPITRLCGNSFFSPQNEGFLKNQEPSFLCELTERAINMNEKKTTYMYTGLNYIFHIYL